MFLAKLAVTGVVLAFVVWKLGWRDIVDTICAANPLWLAAALAVFYVSCGLGAVQWQILLRNRGIRIPFAQAYKLYFVGMFFNNFIFGLVAGDAVRVTYLSLAKESLRAGFAATFLDRFAGFFAMSIFAVAASCVLLGGGRLNAGLDTTVLALFAAFVLFALVIAFLLSRKLQALFFRVLERLPLPQKARIRGVIEEMLIEAHDTHILAPVAAISLVVQFLRVAVHVLCAVALGIASAATLHYFFIFVPVLAVSMVVPLPFGIREAAEGSLFALAGFRPEAAMVMGFLASLVGISISMVGAVYFVAGKKHLKGTAS
jgi:uncharacterized protein (TIRG00374 family)